MQQTLEVIDYQSRGRFDKLVDIFMDVRAIIRGKGIGGGTDRFLDREIAPRLEAEIKRLFNISSIVIIGYDEDSVAAVAPPVLGSRNILSTIEFRKYTEDEEANQVDKSIFDRAMIGEVGTIDISTGRVGGVYADASADFYLDLGLQYTIGCTAGEMTAILLHEVGHVVGYFEYGAHTASINRVLMNALSRKKTDPRANRKLITHELIEMNTITNSIHPDTLAKLKNTSNGIIYGWRLSKVVAEHLSTHSFSSRYDNTSSEQLADSFATRCGFGVESLTSLQKIETYYIDGNVPVTTSDVVGMTAVSRFTPVTTTLFKEVFTALAAGAIAILLAVGVALVTWIFNKVFQSVLPSPQNGSESSEYKRGTLRYDEAHYRLQRIRNDIVNMLREIPKLSKAAKQDILLQLEMFDKLLETPRPNAIEERLIGMLDSPLTDDDTQQVLIERMLEEVLNNPLLVSATRATLI